jgi:IS5 family transposase
MAQGQEATGSDDSPRPAGAAPDARAGVARQHPSRGKLLSLFEAHTEVIRKGKAHKPNEFGGFVKDFV